MSSAAVAPEQRIPQFNLYEYIKHLQSCGALLALIVMFGSSKFGGSLKWTCVGLVLLVGCAGPAARRNSMSFQGGQALSNEQILLKNIIAAAHDRTPTFVAASGVTSQAKMDARLAAAFEIPRLMNHSLSPEIGGAREQAVTILDYGATKAAQHLYTAVPPDYARQLVVQGWHYGVVLTLLLSSIQVDPTLDRLIAQKAERRCNDNRDSSDACTFIESVKNRCGDPIASGLYVNDAQDRCTFQLFQVLLLRLHLTGTEARVADLPVEKKDGKPVLDSNDQPVRKAEIVELFEDPEIESLFHQLKARLIPGERPPLALYLRSPAQIIEFLGALAALQLYYERPFVADVGGFPLFRIERGANRAEPAAVSVRVGGQRYYVPEPIPLSSRRDLSVKVMSLVIELQNRARQEAPIQGSAIAILQ